MSLLLAACGGTPAAPQAPAAEATPVEAAVEPTAVPTEEAVAEATTAPTEEPTEEATEEPAAEATAEATEEATSEATPAAEEEGTASALEGVTWQVVEYAGADRAMAAPVADATMAFNNGQISGNAGCNGFFAGYVIDGAQLTIEQGASTMMACPEPEMAQETAIWAALGQAASYTVVDGQLTILNSDGVAVISFAAQEVASLTGVVWRATDYNEGNGSVVVVMEGTEITAIFSEEGGLSGSAGCNNYVTQYKLDGSQINIGPAASTMMFCEEPAGVMEQESAYLKALESAATFAVEGQSLTLLAADGALVAHYQAAVESVVAGVAAASADPDPVTAETATDEAAVELAVAAAETASGSVTAQLGVNVRTGPSTQFPIVGIAPLGTTGEIIGISEDGQWWVARVPSAPNEQGWVAAAYVDAVNADDVPVLPAPPLPEVVAAIQEGASYEVGANVILFSASRVVREGNRVYELEDIDAVPATAGAEAELVATNAMQPALSPDGKTLAVYSKQSDKLGLGGYDVTTGRRLRFSAFIEDSSPRWSPTGDRLVFASNRQGDRRWRIYTTQAVDQALTANMTYVELSFGKDPDWHPTEDLLILKGCDDQGQNCGTYTMNADGSERTIFTNEATDSMPRWLPDGSGVVFMSEGRDGNWEIYQASTADGSVTRLTNDPAPDGLPAVSPDGQQIAFISKRSGAWGLWVMPITGGDATQITAIAGELPDWLMQAVDWPQ
jgi:heat shock protein HslJ